MKKLILSILFLLVVCSFTSAQSFRAELEKARSIRLLESNREDVQKILAGYKSDIKATEIKDTEPIYNETFSSKIAEIEIEYTEGDCSDQSIWNLPVGIVKYIEITPEKTIKFSDFNMEFSGLRKEQMYFGNKDRFVYHNKSLGIAFFVDKDEIEKIVFQPTNSFYSKLCDNEETIDYKKYFTSESYFLEPKLENRTGETSCPVPVINELVLSKKEIVFSCKGNDDKKVGKISVWAKATDPEDDVLVYSYNVSAGTIIGQGSKVVWDLSEAMLGTHTITATIDDGCGVCAQPRTEVVVVKNCE